MIQDGAPGHTGGNTREELSRRGVQSINWPAYLPDLNLIETVWNRIKDYVADNYPDKLSYNQLRQAVKDAWESISSEFLGNLIAKMPVRCAAVIDAQGMYTRY